MIDFMCHKRLLLQLNSRVNFISGRNGSGKSACLTALTICLGNRASSTQRGSSLSELIREGCEEAIIRISINNDHEFPFKFEAYGSTILIERKINRNGLGKYHVFAANSNKKNLISDKKEEVILICDHFGIQVENPLSILTQETAKKFLSVASPKDLYKFFLKATQLDQMQNDFCYANEKIVESRSKLDQEERNLKYLEQMIYDLKSKIDLVLEFQQIAHRKSELEREYFWAQFRDLDLERIVQNNKLTSMTQELNNIRIQSKELELNYASLSSKIGLIESEIASLHEQSLTLRDQKSKCSTLLQNEKLSLKKLQDESESMSKEFRGLEERIDLYRQRIKTKDCERDIDILKEKINHQETCILELNSKIELITNKQKTTKEKYQKSLELLTQLQFDYNKIEKQLMKAHDDLNHAQSSLDNRINFYGSWVPRVLDFISKNDFEKSPIGPIGLHVTIKEFDKWSLSMSSIMGKDMRGFIVCNHSDRNKLQSIFNRLFLKNIPIFVINFDSKLSTFKKDGSSMGSFPPDGNELLTALKVLEIDNEIVRKTLMIQHNIEQVILFEDREAAMNFLWGNSRGIHSCFTRTARMNLNRKTGALTYINLYQTNEPSFVQGSEQRIKIVHDFVDDLKTKKNKFNEEILNLKRQNDLGNNLISNLFQEKFELESVINEKKSKLKQDELELEKILSDNNGNFLENELAEIERCSNNLKIQISAINQKQSEILSRIQQLDLKNADFDNEQKSLQDKHIELEIKLKDAVKSKQSGIQEKKQIEKLIAENQENFSIESSKLENLSLKVTEMNSQALHKGIRIFTDKSIATIIQEISRQEILFVELKNIRIDTIDSLKHELDRLESIMTEVKKQLNFNGNLENKLTNALKNRSDITTKLREELALKSNINFITLLCSRGFYGQLIYDFQNEVLNLNIATENEGSETKTRNVRQLSGGERSFATSCLLFALWNSMRCPLLALDEFDVFMDPVNRNLTLKLLIEHAKQSKSQYILITPNSLR